MYCVYNALAKTLDYELVAEAMLYGSSEDVAKATDLLAKTSRTCAATHGLSESQLPSLGDIGAYGATLDYLSEDLMFEDVSDEAIDGIYAVLDSLSDGELDKFYEDNWRSDAAFEAKLKAAVIAKGIPDEVFAIDTAFQIMMLAQLELDAEIDFMLESVGNQDSAN